MREESQRLLGGGWVGRSPLLLLEKRLFPTASKTTTRETLPEYSQGG